MKDTPQQYERKKGHIIAVFREALARGAAVGLDKKTSNLFRSREKAKHLIDVSDLNRVIRIDEQNMLAEVEGMTTFDDFIKETLRHGLLPAVVPEQSKLCSKS